MTKIYLKIIDKVFSIPTNCNVIINHKNMADGTVKKAVGISPTIFVDAPNQYFNLPVGFYRLKHLVQYKPDTTPNKWAYLATHFDTQFILNINDIPQTPLTFKLPITSNTLETTLTWDFTFEVKDISDKIYFQWTPTVFNANYDAVQNKFCAFDLKYTTFELESIDFPE